MRDIDRSETAYRTLRPWARWMIDRRLGLLMLALYCALILPSLVIWVVGAVRNALTGMPAMLRSEWRTVRLACKHKAAHAGERQGDSA